MLTVGRGLFQMTPSKNGSSFGIFDIVGNCNTHLQSMRNITAFLNLVQIIFIFSDNVRMLSICKRSNIRTWSHRRISNDVYLITIYKPHIGICGDSHLSATFFCDPFVHFEATQFPYPSKEALYKTEKKPHTILIFNRRRSFHKFIT